MDECTLGGGRELSHAISQEIPAVFLTEQTSTQLGKLEE